MFRYFVPNVKSGKSFTLMNNAFSSRKEWFRDGILTWEYSSMTVWVRREMKNTTATLSATDISTTNLFGVVSVVSYTLSK